MTAQEIIAENDMSNRSMLESRNLPVSEAMLALMNEASVNGVALGIKIMQAMIDGTVAVHKAQQGGENA